MLEKKLVVVAGFCEQVCRVEFPQVGYFAGNFRDFCHLRLTYALKCPSKYRLVASNSLPGRAGIFWKASRVCQLSSREEFLAAEVLQDRHTESTRSRF